MEDHIIRRGYAILVSPLVEGFWERMELKVVRQPLKTTVGRTTLHHDELQTTLVEIEAIINVRLVTYVYDDEESIFNPLTPSHLITGRRITGTRNNRTSKLLVLTRP